MIPSQSVTELFNLAFSDIFNSNKSSSMSFYGAVDSSNNPIIETISTDKEQSEVRLQGLFSPSQINMLNIKVKKLSINVIEEVPNA